MLNLKIMKRTLIIIAFSTAQIVWCQTPVLPLSTYEDIPNGAYLQDLNNSFGQYIGIWEGTLNNKKYTFEFTKFEQHYDDFSLCYEDILKSKFRVTDITSGTIEYDGLSASDYDDYRILTIPPPSNGMLHCFFTDTDANCRNELEFYLRNINGQPNKLTYCNFRYTDEWGLPGIECVDYADRMDIPVFLPMQDLILTKL